MSWRFGDAVADCPSHSDVITAMKVGAVAVRRYSHVKNVNKCAVWSTNAKRQFRSVVAWKEQVRSSLRDCIAHVGTSSSGAGKEAVAMAELLETFRECLVGAPREPLLTSCSTPVEPSNDNVNIGLDMFRCFSSQPVCLFILVRLCVD